MPRISCYISESTLNKIKELQCEDEFYKSQSQSQFLKKIIENGLNNLLYESSEIVDKLEKLNEKITAFTLKNTTLCAEILSCVFDENKINKSQAMIKERVMGIKKRVDAHMEKLQAESVD